MDIRHSKAQNWLGHKSDTESPQRVLREVFGHESFLRGQSENVRAALQGRDILHYSPTGSGKSLMFQLPALMEKRGDTTLVVSPLIALMSEQVLKLRALGIPCGELHSQTDTEETLQALERKEYALLFASPEQLMTTRNMEALKRASIPRIVVDEAHCVSTWGRDFRPEYRNIGIARREIDASAMSAFTATASALVDKDIREALSLNDPFRHEEDPHRPNLRYSVLPVEGKKQKMDAIFDLLHRYSVYEDDAAIIYCGRQADTVKIQQELSLNDVPGIAYHGGMSKDERREKELAFFRDEPSIIAATNAFGMGVDKPNVRLVIHRDMPGSVLAYLQETGRAGRDGDDAHCALLYDQKDAGLHEHFLEERLPGMNFVHAVHRILTEMVQKSPLRIGDQGRVNLFALRKRFLRGHRFVGRAAIPQEHDSMVNAALTVLEQVGVIRQNGEMFAVQPFADGSAEERMATEVLAIRRRLGEHALQGMKRYATHPEPTQDLLLEILKEEEAFV